jgi:hypothetical protein
MSTSTTARGGDGSLHASTGDRLVVRSLHGPVRDAEILEVRHPDGTPPYVVRWSDTGHEALVYPGADAFVEHFAGPAGPTAAPRA